MRRLVLSVCMVAVPALGACGGSSSPTQPTTASISGVFALKTVNGGALPYVIPQTGYDKAELMSDVVTGNDGAFTDSITYRLTEAGQISTQVFADTGAYSISGTAVTFTYEDGTTGTGTVSGNSYTVALHGASYYYVKQ